MLDKVKNTIKRFRMLHKGDTVVAAVSGGVDSVVLLHILTRLAAEYKISLIAAHINHSLRGKESDRDEAFIRSLAKRLGVPCACKKVDTRKLLKRGDSLQDVARKARYAFFEETAKRYKAQKIATGHNLDDQAETMAMRFLNGAGLRGLCGIPAVRGKYIRPLLDITRGEIEKYAEAERLKFVKDSSNQSAKYLRNHIRLKLMPALTGYNPAFKNDMARLSRILARDEDYLCSQAKDAYTNCMKGEQKVKGQGARGKGKTSVALSVKKLNSLHDAIKVRVFFMVAEELLGSSAGFYSCHVEDFLKLLSGKAPNISINLPHGLTVYREYDRAAMERSQKPGVRSQKKDRGIIFEQELKIDGRTEVIADCGLRIAEFKTKVQNRKSEIVNLKSQRVAYFDYDKLKAPLLIRNFRSGDRFVPFGMSGHKKIKDLFIEKKIPRRKRGLIPLILSGNEIIWVAGVRQGAYGRVGPETKRVLKIVVVEAGFTPIPNFQSQLET